MTITDCIAIAALIGALTYSMTGFGLLMRNTWATPPPHKRPALRYSDFQKINDRACCTIIAEAIQVWDRPYWEMTRGKKVVERVYVNYCPQCGRKLK